MLLKWGVGADYAEGGGGDTLSVTCPQGTKYQYLPGVCVEGWGEFYLKSTPEQILEKLFTIFHLNEENPKVLPPASLIRTQTGI